MAAAESAAREKDVEAPEKKKSSFVVDAEFEEVVQTMLPQTDDVHAPSLTWRVWLIGIIACCSLGIINQIFMFRTNPFGITSYVFTLLSYPMGVMLARVVPRRQIGFGRFSFDTNPGPFSIKEHVLISIFASTGASGIYGNENIIVQKIFYKLELPHIWAIMFLFTTSTLGFGLSGICRKFLIRPSHMLWPSLLPSVALFTSFHKNALQTSANEDSKAHEGSKFIEKPNPAADDDYDENGKKRMSRLAFFGIFLLVAFAFYIIGPGWLSPRLSYFPILCWLAPVSSVTLQQLGSPKYGTGILAGSFDLSITGTSGMTLPFWTSINYVTCWIIFKWILIPLAWQNKWFNEPKTKLALNSQGLFNRNGKPIKAADLVDLKTIKIDEAKYLANAKIYMTPFFAFSYFGSMAQFTGAISNMVVWFGKDIWTRLRASRYDEDDVHCRLIDKYPEVPNSWYYGFFIVTSVLSIVTCHFSGIDMKWYYTILAIVISIVGTIPIAIVVATAGAYMGLNVISEFVIGLMEPGAPVMMMAFKCMSVLVCAQSLTLLEDLKLGHYMKVPPRHVFIAQISSQIIAVFVCYATTIMWISNDQHVEWILQRGSAKGIGQFWGALSPNIYFTASLIWGAIGPARFFFESVYSPVIVGGLLIGAVTPLVAKLCHTFIGGPFPWRLINPVLLFSISSPGGAQVTILPKLIMAFVFQFWLYRRARAWWKRYNYILATALSVGTAFGTLFATLVLSDYEIEAPKWLLNPVEDAALYGPYNDGCIYPPGEY